MFKFNRSAWRARGAVVARFFQVVWKPAGVIVLGLLALGVVGGIIYASFRATGEASNHFAAAYNGADPNMRLATLLIIGLFLAWLFWGRREEKRTPIVVNAPPTSGTASAGPLPNPFVLTVKPAAGERFTRTTELIVNGTPLPTHYVNSEQVAAYVSHELLAGIGGLVIQVRK